MGRGSTKLQKVETGLALISNYHAHTADKDSESNAGYR